MYTRIYLEKQGGPSFIMPRIVSDMWKFCGLKLRAHVRLSAKSTWGVWYVLRGLGIGLFSRMLGLHVYVCMLWVGGVRLSSRSTWLCVLVV